MLNVLEQRGHVMIIPRIIVYSILAVAVYLVFNSQLLSAVGMQPVILPFGGQGLQSQWPDTDFSKRNIKLEEITSGGPPKDGIPAIDKPVFETVMNAGRWLDAAEPVIVVERNKKARAYPLQILIYHEIVNDMFQGLPISVTFCPLCNASIVYDRRLSGNVLDFGTTGNLRMSDLVMYDRQTQSWWQQFTGEGIVGHYTGRQLQEVPSKIVSFEQFSENFPQAEVLSRQTGYSRPYGSNPYRGYDRVGDMPFLFTDPVDNRLPAMERAIGVGFSGTQGQPSLKLYPFSALENHALIHDKPGDLPIVIFVKEGLLSVLDQATIKESRTIFSAVAYDRRVSGKELNFKVYDGKILDVQSGSHWNIFGHAVSGPMKGAQLQSVDNGVHFAFAWLAFHPDAQIYRR